MANYNEYIYGSAAPDRRKRIDPGTEIRKIEKRKPKKKIDKVAVVLAMVTFSLVFFVSFNYLQKQFQATYLSKNIVSLENEIVELEKQNQAASEKVETAMDLSVIYKKATSELGMVHAKNNQVLAYESKKSNQVRQYGNIPSK